MTSCTGRSGWYALKRRANTVYQRSSAKRLFYQSHAGDRSAFANVGVVVPRDENGRHGTLSIPEVGYHLQTVHRQHVEVDNQAA